MDNDPDKLALARRVECDPCHGTGVEPDGLQCRYCHGHGSVEVVQAHLKGNPDAEV